MASKNTPVTKTENVSMARLKELFTSKVVLDGDDPEVVQLRMVERIFQAETADDILSAGGSEVTHARDALGIPFNVQDIDWQVSDKEGDNIGVYAVFHATNLFTGEKQVLTCGGTNVAAAALALKERNLLPVQAKFKQADKPTARGYYPLWLVKLDDNDLKRIEAMHVNAESEDRF